jgi:hypothetical protein
VAYASSFRNKLDFLWLKFYILPNSFPSTIPSSFKLSEAADLSDISTRYCSSHSSSFQFFRIEPLHMKSLRYLLTHGRFLHKFWHQKIVVSITVCCPEISYINIFESRLLSIGIWSVWLRVFPSVVQINLWMLRCGNIEKLTVIFLDVPKFTALSQLSLLISYQLLFPVFGLKISSIPTLAVKSPNKIFIFFYGIYGIPFVFLSRICPSYNQL